MTTTDLAASQSMPWSITLHIALMSLVALALLPLAVNTAANRSTYHPAIVRLVQQAKAKGLFAHRADCVHPGSGTAGDTYIHVHTMLTSFSGFCLVVAWIIPFVSADDLTQHYRSWHAILGCVINFLVVFQQPKLASTNSSADRRDRWKHRKLGYAIVTAVAVNVVLGWSEVFDRYIDDD